MNLYFFWIGFAGGAAACAADNGDWATVAVMMAFGLAGLGAAVSSKRGHL